MELLLAGGPLLIVIAIASIVALTIFLQRMLVLARERMDAAALMADVNEAIHARDLESALEVCAQHGGPVARVIEYALSRLPYGRPAVESAFNEASLEEEASLSRGLPALATIAQISPLLGLLGTVTGMILAFSDLSQQAGATDTATVSRGISQALITTAAGLLVAIPSLIAHNYLSARVDGMLLEIERRREELLGNVAQVVAQQRQEAGQDLEQDGEQAMGRDMRQGEGVYDGRRHSASEKVEDGDV